MVHVVAALEFGWVVLVIVIGLSFSILPSGCFDASIFVSSGFLSIDFLCSFRDEFTNFVISLDYQLYFFDHVVILEIFGSLRMSLLVLVSRDGFVRASSILAAYFGFIINVALPLASVPPLLAHAFL